MSDSELETLLNCNEVLRSKINVFIEALIEYYGESERQYITEKFSNALFCGYIQDIEFNAVLSKLEAIESERIYDELLSNGRSTFTKSQLFGKDLYGTQSLENYRSHPVYKYKTFYDECILGAEGRKEKYIRESYEKLCQKTSKVTYEEFKEMSEAGKIPKAFENSSDQVKEVLLDYADISWDIRKYENEKRLAVEYLKKFYPEITIDNVEEKASGLTELNYIISHYPEMIEKFERFKSKYQSFYNMKKYNEDLSEKTDESCYREYLTVLIDYIPEKFKGSLQEFLTQNIKPYKLDGDLRGIIGYTLNGTSPLESFGSDMEEKLNSKDTAEWEKDSIKRKRIEYFKAIGIDLGDEYEKYAEKQDMFPDSSKIDELIQKKKIIVSKRDQEYHNNSFQGKDFISEALSMGFLDNDKTELPGIFMKGSTCVSTNVVSRNGKYLPAAKVLIEFSQNNPEVRDHFIIHELNHFYELSLSSVTEKGYAGLCGWDQYYGSFNNQESVIELERPKRPYELFNEIINEKIAQEISELMVKKGIGVFSKPTDESYKNKTAYDSTSYLVDDFFEMYKSEIIASRKDGNIQVIYDAVGKENFDELNSLFALHNERFGGMRYYSLLSDLRDKKETENVRFFRELLSKRDMVLEKMKEHYESRSVSK